MLAAVVVAAASAVGAMAVLKQHEHRTTQLVQARQDELGATMAKLEDDYRRITKNLGFNVLILPLDQNVADFFADDFASQTMPESYVDKLATSPIVTVRHLLPSLQRKLVWPEQQQTIILIGTRGEVPVTHLDPKKPIMQPITPGTAVLGYELHRRTGLEAGDTMMLKGQSFEVAKVHESRGTKDDITVWIHLAEAQAMLDLDGEINGILALECACAFGDLPQIRREIEAILPSTQVLEFRTQALVRAETRQRAAEAAREVAEGDIAAQLTLRDARVQQTWTLVTTVAAGAGLIMWLLSTINMRSRRAEMGILRAIGVPSSRLLALVLGKAAVIGMIGAAGGYGLGMAIGKIFAMQAGASGSAGIPIFDGRVLGVVVVAATFLCMFAAWLPAIVAATRDPAEVLRDG